MKKGVSLVEVMISMIILAFLLTALYHSFSSSRQVAGDIMANHSINDKLDHTLLRIIDDIRESNSVDPDHPKTIEPMELTTLTTDPNNTIKFEKYNYDFSKDPSTLSDGEVNHTRNDVTYFLEKENDQDSNSTWVLLREMVPYDRYKQKVDSLTTVYPVLTGIRECVFYRLSDEQVSGGGNIHIRLKLVRTDTADEDSKYANDVTIVVKERGANPE